MGQAPERLVTGGRAVRLDGYHIQPVNTLEVLGLGREKLLLLVVPPRTDPDRAHESLMTAAAPDDITSVDDLLRKTAGARGVSIGESRDQRSCYLKIKSVESGGLPCTSQRFEGMGTLHHGDCRLVAPHAGASISDVPNSGCSVNSVGNPASPGCVSRFPLTAPSNRSRRTRR